MQEETEQEPYFGQMVPSLVKEILELPFAGKTKISTAGKPVVFS